MGKLRDGTIMGRCICIGIATLYATACSGNPSVDLAKKELEKRYGSKARIVEIKKINGVERELMGQKLYSMDVEAKIEYLEDVINPKVNMFEKFTVEELRSLEKDPLLHKKGDMVKGREELRLCPALMGPKRNSKPTVQSAKSTLDEMRQYSGSIIRSVRISDIKTKNICLGKSKGYEYIVEFERVLQHDVDKPRWNAARRRLMPNESIWSHKKGEIKTIKETFNFAKTEQGWQ